MSETYVVKGAEMECTCGDAKSSLDIPRDHGVFINDTAQANAQDYIPMINIKPFGKCSSLANPTVAAATAAALGALQAMPCVPAIVSPWAGTKTGLMINNAPAVVTSSKLLCAWCGTVSITDDGQK